jgi:GTPase SAR1 family protein
MSNLKAIFVTGTAGSGKSLLTSKLLQWYRDTGAFPATLNLDPGSVRLPYEPDIDVRNYIDINTLMDSYGLGPNGSLVMASDMIATRLDEIQSEVDELNPDYIIVDTPGQIELFAFRASGPYFVSNLRAEEKVTIFAFDGMLVSTPINFVSVSLLASSVKLRLKTAQVNALTKRDLVTDRLVKIMEWSNSAYALDAALADEKDVEYSMLSRDFAKSLSKSGFGQSIIAVSSLTMSGMVNLVAALSRTVNQGEDG